MCVSGVESWRKIERHSFLWDVWTNLVYTLFVLQGVEKGGTQQHYMYNCCPQVNAACA